MQIVRHWHNFSTVTTGYVSRVVKDVGLSPASSNDVDKESIQRDKVLHILQCLWRTCRDLEAGNFDQLNKNGMNVIT